MTGIPENQVFKDMYVNSALYSQNFLTSQIHYKSAHNKRMLYFEKSFEKHINAYHVFEKEFRVVSNGFNLLF